MKSADKRLSLGKHDLHIYIYSLMEWNWTGTHAFGAPTCIRPTPLLTRAPCSARASELDELFSLESCLPRSAGAACAGGSDGSNKKLCSQVVAHLRPPRRPLHPAARTLAVDLLQPQRQTCRLAWPNPYGPESPKVTRLGGNRRAAPNTG